MFISWEDIAPEQQERARRLTCYFALSLGCPGPVVAAVMRHAGPDLSLVKLPNDELWLRLEDRIVGYILACIPNVQLVVRRSDRSLTNPDATASRVFLEVAIDANNERLRLRYVLLVEQADFEHLVMMELMITAKRAVKAKLRNRFTEENTKRTLTTWLANVELSTILDEFLEHQSEMERANIEEQSNKFRRRLEEHASRQHAVAHAIFNLFQQQAGVDNINRQLAEIHRRSKREERTRKRKN